MQQKWWLFAAGGIGIALAVLLFPRPDTGETPALPASTVSEEAEAQPLNVKRDAPRRVVERPGGRSIADRANLKQIEGAPPVARAAKERRETPAALYATRATGPWTMLRRELMLMEGDDYASSLSDDIQQLILDLRGIRRDPTSEAYEVLAGRQRDVVEKIRKVPEWTANETVMISIDRIENFLSDYASETKE